MIGESIGVVGDHLWIELSDRFSHAAMVISKPATENGAVGCFSEQFMAEGIFRLGALGPFVDQFCSQELVELAFDGSPIPQHLSKHAPAEGASDHGGDLQRVSGAGAQPIDAGGQQSLKRFRNGDFVDRR